MGCCWSFWAADMVDDVVVGDVLGRRTGGGCNGYICDLHVFGALVTLCTSDSHHTPNLHHHGVPSRQGMFLVVAHPTHVLIGAGSPQLPPRLCSGRTRQLSAAPCTHPAVEYLRARVLLYNVRPLPSFPLFMLILYRLPKSGVPLKELAVASTASVLGGFGVVALFCTAGVYV